jgi:capsular polysaccharide biosynthesis protein
VKTLLVRAIAASLLVAAVVTLASLLQTPKYETSARVQVDFRKQSDGQTHPLPNSSQLRELVREITVDIDRRPVAEEAIRRLGLRMDPAEVLDNLTARQVEASRFIRLTYTDTDAKRAKEVANTVGEIASERFSKAGAGSPGGNLTTTLVRRAPVPETPVSPKPLRNGLLALVVGLVLSAALIAGREFLRR